MLQTPAPIPFSSPCRAHSRSPAPTLASPRAPPAVPPFSTDEKYVTESAKVLTAAVFLATITIADFILPDLVSHCTYERVRNPEWDTVARASEKWLLETASHTGSKLDKFMGLKAGELTAACYHTANPYRLKVCDDFMNYLFNLDDWLDEFDVTDTIGMHETCIGAMLDPENFVTDKKAGILTKSFFGRFAADAGPGCRRRFIHTMDLFFKAVAIQSHDRLMGTIPTLEDYIRVRRDTSGCKPCFQLIEFANGFDLPDEVSNHPVIQKLEEHTNDLVTWSNDIFSWNVEQSRNDRTHNMIPIVMFHKNLTHQQAIDFVGEKCRECIEGFEELRTKHVPDFGSDKVNGWVSLYIDGLKNWICGSLHWSFETERYFGKNGAAVKESRFVKLMSALKVAPGSHAQD